MGITFTLVNMNMLELEKEIKLNQNFSHFYIASIIAILTDKIADFNNSTIFTLQFWKYPNILHDIHSPSNLPNG